MKVKKYSYKYLDVPVEQMYCHACKRAVKPITQTRMPAEEWTIEEVDAILWDCPVCGTSYCTPDDVLILSAAEIY